MNKFVVFSFSFMMASVVFAACPDGGELKNGTCCKDGKALARGDTTGYTMVRPACGCPDGGKASEHSEWFCCKNGQAYNRQTQRYDKHHPYCGCPDGGTFTLSKDESPQCCKDNLVYNSSTKKYDYVRPQSCGCPDGGKTSTNGGYCCKNDYQYNEKTHKYDYLNPGECGCPNGGELKLGVGVNNGDVCCKNGYAHKWYFGTGPVIYDEIDADKCGCPDGATPSEQGRFCCKNGFVLGEKYVQPHVCGCPDGGTVVDYNCIKNGLLWSDQHQKYDQVSTRYGCPADSVEMSGVCCKGKFAYNNDTGLFDGIDGRCGCPEGSKHSSWGAALLELGEDEKLPFVMSLCCKDGKAYNPQNKAFDTKIVFCNPVPKDKKKVSETLLKMDMHMALFILNKLH